MLKSPSSAQLVPLNNSVFPDAAGTDPPKAKAPVAVPDPAKPFLEVFKSFTSVQLVPFHDSAFAVPPKAKAAVLVPDAAKNFLAVFKSPTSVQAVPFQASTTAVSAVALPALAAVDARSAVAAFG